MTRRSPRILVCPQEFKGSLTAREATSAIAEGAAAALGDSAQIQELPLADGGPGTVDVCVAITGAERIFTTVTGPFGQAQSASYGLMKNSDDFSAVIESAAACGLVLVPPDDRHPNRASTHGVGELILDSLEKGARRIVIGVGGTCTNDGGAGAAQALGIRLLDQSGTEIPRGTLNMMRLASLDTEKIHPELSNAELCLAVDVNNPLLGANGATAIYGPQKGACDWQLPGFDEALSTWVTTIEDALNLSLANLPGAGAGGGLPIGLLAATHAAGGSISIESGAALVGDLVKLRKAIANADLVVTGEGSTDSQTAFGKTVSHVASLSAEIGTRCCVISGNIDGLPDGVIDSEVSTPPGSSVEEALLLGSQPIRLAAKKLIERTISR